MSDRTLFNRCVHEALDNAQQTLQIFWTPKMAKEVIPVVAKLLAVKIWQLLKLMAHNL
jgi:hypothetical protein